MFNVNLEYILSIALYMTDSRNDTLHRNNFVGNILKLLMKMRNANDRHTIVNANVYPSALRVSEATHPFKIFVLPNAFIFCILILVVHVANLANIRDNYIYFNTP